MNFFRKISKQFKKIGFLLWKFEFKSELKSYNFIQQKIDETQILINALTTFNEKSELSDMLLKNALSNFELWKIIQHNHVVCLKNLWKKEIRSFEQSDCVLPIELQMKDQQNNEQQEHC